MTERLFTPVSIGKHALRHRVAMAPLTRSRAGQPGNVPTPMNVEYYRQRASAALIVTEATQISQQGQAMRGRPASTAKPRLQAGAR